MLRAPSPTADDLNPKSLCLKVVTKNDRNMTVPTTSRIVLFLLSVSS